MCNPGVSRWACRPDPRHSAGLGPLPHPLVELVDAVLSLSKQTRLNSPIRSNHSSHRAPQNQDVGGE